VRSLLRRDSSIRVAAALVVAVVLAVAGGCSQNPAAPESEVHETIVVDAGGAGDYVTIQAALDAADEGDTVLVLPGTYTGPGNRGLDFGGTDVVLKGRAGSDSTIIDCDGEDRAIYLHAGETNRAVIEGLTIVNGSAGRDDRGGGIYLVGASPTIRDVALVGNSADNGAGLYCQGGASPTITDVVFESNEANEAGGGMFCGSGCAPTVSAATFRDNTANSGGGLACVFADLVIEDTAFIENEAAVAGGAIYCGGASPSIQKVVLIGNTALEGGAVACRDGASPTIKRTTMATNGAITGGGVSCTNDSSPSIAQSIIAFSVAGAAVECADESNPTTSHSCLFGNPGGDLPCGTQSENLFTDPLFCNLAGGDVTLCKDSECPPANRRAGAR